MTWTGPCWNGFWAVLIFSVFFPGLFSGCARDSDSETQTTPTREEIERATAGHLELELAAIRAEARLPGGQEADRDFSRKNIEESVAKIENQISVGERDIYFSVLVRQLTDAYRFEEAIQVAKKIKDVEVRDPLLQDMVRLQADEINEALRNAERFLSTERFPEEILRLFRQADDAIREIGDPLRRTRSFEHVALIRKKAGDRDGAIRVIRDAAESLKNTDDNPGKAQGFFSLARWTFQQDEPDAALEFCREAEASAKFFEHPFASAMFLLDLAQIYAILGKGTEADSLCDKIERFLPKVSDPGEKATGWLKLAETRLVVPTNEQEIRVAKKLLQTREYALKAGTILSDELRDETAAATRSQLVERKNEVLGKIAAMQIWISPLEDVWETVQDIDEGPFRDKALVAAVEMLIAVRSPDAGAWAEEISDTKTKRELLKKIPATEE